MSSDLSLDLLLHKVRLLRRLINVNYVPLVLGRVLLSVNPAIYFAVCWAQAMAILIDCFFQP